MESNKISLKDFLIRFTAISETFIDEYLSFYTKSLNDSFGIELQ